jgi:uncharacterized membrane protein (UPF0127 family)
MLDRRRNLSRDAVTTIFRFALGFFVLCADPALAAPFAVEPLQIVTATGKHVLNVQMARTPEEQEQGLMFRRSLPEDVGMLFDYQSDQEILMWMKNTYIPLDMIFVASDGRVVSIARNAEPLSEAIISSRSTASAVIEVNAGTADKLAVTVGDLMRHPIFDRPNDRSARGASASR